MFNPTDFDEVCVQVIHIQLGGRTFSQTFKKPFNHSDNKYSKEGKGKSKLKGKKSETTKKEGERPTCTHCQRVGNEESKCWKLHPELKPKKFLKKKGEMKANATVQQDLGSDFGDEKKIFDMCLTGFPYETSSSSTCSASPSKANNMIEEKKRVELFHIRIISKHTKIDTLLDSGPQENIISEEIVWKLGFETKNHPKPYPLGWLKENT